MAVDTAFQVNVGVEIVTGPVGATRLALPGTPSAITVCASPRVATARHARTNTSVGMNRRLTAVRRFKITATRKA